MDYGIQISLHFSAAPETLLQPQSQQPQQAAAHPYSAYDSTANPNPYPNPIVRPEDPSPSALVYADGQVVPYGGYQPQHTAPYPYAQALAAASFQQAAFICEVCKINCNSQETLNTHKMGKKHKGKLQKLQEPSSVAFADKNFLAGQDKTKIMEEVKKASIKDDLKTKKEKIIMGGADEGAIMVCAACDVVCNSKVVYESHVTGKKHLSTVKKQETRV